MPIKLGLFLRALLIAACFGIVQCGGESESQKVNIRIEAKTPIIITAPGKDRAGNDIAAPWFQFRVLVHNTSETKDLTIVGLKLISVLNEPGVQEQEFGFTSSYFNFTTAAGTECAWYEFWYKDPSVVAPANPYLPYFPANQSAESELYLPDPFDPTAASPTCGNYRAVFIAGGLNKSPNKDSKNYRYRVTMEVLGWFGRPDNQEDRFTRRVTFYTR